MSNPYRHPISTPVPELQGKVSIASNLVPSCAPGEVERLRDQLANEAKDWRHNAYTRVMLSQMHDRLAALSPQGLDAKEGGE